MPPAIDREEALARAGKAVATHKSDPGQGELVLRELKRAEVPGWLVFRARIVPTDSQQRPSPWTVGMVSADEVVLTEAKTLPRLFAAWGYGPKARPVSADTFARVVAFLQSHTSSVSAVLSDTDLESLRPDLRKRLSAPRERSVWGKTAVEFWSRSGNPPFWLNTIVFASDGTFTATRKTL